MKYISLAPLCALCLLLGGCVLNLSPSYEAPAMPQPVPTEYKEEDGWKTATPMEAVDRGPWWEMFGDPMLNQLMVRLNEANQDIAVAAANLRKARAQVGSARAAFLPGVSVPASMTRGNSGGIIQETYSYGLDVQWEINLWNSLPAFEAARAEARASAADYAAMRLSTQSELATSYFQLRVLDVQMDLYEGTVAAYAKAVQLTRSQYQGGIVTPADVAQAEAQLASAEAQLAALERQRAELEHGIAILTGQIPAHFTLPRGQLTARIPSIPTGLPSTLLERRPDIAAAERRVASANQQIGIARGAWFPTFSLGGSRSRQGVNWFTVPVTVWSLGPSAALSVFEGGKHLAESDAAWASYEAAVASYRQTALQAFKEVEDGLSALNYLDKEAEAQSRAVMASRMALRLSLSQYRGGMTTYLQVVNAQTTALNNERSAIQVQGDQLIASVSLFKALGGGWQAKEMEDLMWGEGPKEGKIE